MPFRCRLLYSRIHEQTLVCQSSALLPGVSGPGPAPPLPVPVSPGLRGPPGLPASAVRHRRRRAQADRPGRRQRRGDGVPVRRRLHPPVPQPQLQPAVLGPRRVRGPEREAEHLQRLQVRGPPGPPPPTPRRFYGCDGWRAKARPTPEALLALLALETPSWKNCNGCAMEKKKKSVSGGGN